MPIYEELARRLAQLDAQSLRRHRRNNDLPCAPHVRIDGRELLSFCSNDYLGLARDPRLIQAAQEGAARWAVGSGASHLVSGHYSVDAALEQRLAAFTGCEAALCFSTGYLANLAIMPSLLARSDEIFADRLNHASLIDGALLSRATLKRYAHNDMQALKRLLQASKAPRKLIVTDTVFSMDGDIAPLPALLELAEAFDAWLLLDDAHGFGILGPQGRGALHAYRLHHPRVIYMATLGKAAGVAGAFVAGSSILVDYLIQSARSYIYTTAAPPLIAHTLLQAIELIEAGDDRRRHLASLIGQLREGMRNSRWQMMDSCTAIQPVVLGDNALALQVAEALYAQGLWVPAIRPPTVAQGSARLRISLSAAHRAEDVARLLDALRQIESRGI